MEINSQNIEAQKKSERYGQSYPQNDYQNPETSLKCKINGHKNKIRNYICTEINCPSHGLICVFCLSSIHKSHQNSCQQIDSFISDTKTSIKQQKSANPQILNEIEKKYIKIREDLDSLKIEFEIITNELQNRVKDQYVQYQEEIKEFETKNMFELLTKIENKEYNSTQELETQIKILLKFKTKIINLYQDDDDFISTLSFDYSTYIKLYLDIFKTFNNLSDFLNKTDSKLPSSINDPKITMTTDNYSTFKNLNQELNGHNPLNSTANASNYGNDYAVDQNQSVVS